MLLSRDLQLRQDTIQTAISPNLASIQDTFPRGRLLGIENGSYANHHDQPKRTKNPPKKKKPIL